MLNTINAIAFFKLVHNTKLVLRFLSNIYFVIKSDAIPILKITILKNEFAPLWD